MINFSNKTFVDKKLISIFAGSKKRGILIKTLFFREIKSKIQET
jgi:hypothetical protein